jgi:hypothetical protein
MRRTAPLNCRTHFDLHLQGCSIRLSTMTDTITELVELFDAQGAFIFGELVLWPVNYY